MRSFLRGLLLLLGFSSVLFPQELFFSLDLDSTKTGSASPGKGSGHAVFNRQTKSLKYDFTVNKLQGNITAAHFHYLPSGGVVHPITMTGKTGSGTWANMPDSLIDALHNGNLYVNVHSSTATGGEVRGTPEPHQNGFPVVLDGAQAGTASEGRGSGYVMIRDTTSGQARRVQYRMTYAGMRGTITASHFHSPDGVVQGITFTDSTADGVWTSLPDSAYPLLLRGKMYVNIHSSFAGGGEIRANLMNVGEYPFLGTIDGAQAGTGSTSNGTVWAVLHPDLKVTYHATYAKLQGTFTNAHFHTAVGGGVVKPVTFVGNTTMGEWTGLTDANIADFFKRNIYINIHSSTATGGEIRGNLDYYDGAFLGVLDGLQAGTPSTAKGTTWMYLLEDSVHYRATFAGLNGTFSASHFHLAPGGSVIHPVSFTDSTTDGYWVPGNNLLDIIKGNVYLNIHSTPNYAGGEIRSNYKLGGGGPPSALIMIDGNKDPFYGTLTGPSNGYLQLRNYAGNNNGTPVSNADLSAKVWAAWDSTWLYMYAEVMDDTISDNGVNSYQDDGLELKIDPQPKDSVASTIFAPNLTIRGGAGSDSLNAFGPAAKMFARKIIPGGYALEFAVMLDSIVSGTEKISKGVDSVFGLAINFHDNDGNLAIGGGRQASVQWAAVMDDAVWNTVKYLGTVKFKAGNKLEFIAKNNVTNVTNPIPFDGTPFYVNVDAAKDYVYNASKGPADGYLQIRSYAYNNNGKPVSDADLSAKVWTAWDPTWLYMYAEVMDDTISDNGVNAYQDDGLELKIDPQPKDSVTASIFAPNLTIRGGAGSDSLNAFGPTAKKWARRLIPGGYALEFAVMLDSIFSGTERISKAVDSVFGLAINFHDNDGNLAIGGGRQASVQWAAVMDDAVWNTVKYLGTVKFLADNKLKFDPKNNVTGVTNPIPYDGSNYTPPTSVEKTEAVPLVFSLGQNYPNPFNPSTTIQFGLPQRSSVRLVVFNVLGQVVAELVNGTHEAGNHKVIFNAGRFSSGVYFYRLEAGSFVDVKKLLLLK